VLTGQTAAFTISAARVNPSMGNSIRLHLPNANFREPRPTTWLRCGCLFRDRGASAFLERHHAQRDVAASQCLLGQEQARRAKVAPARDRSHGLFNPPIQRFLAVLPG
jgi:hypothetical protein